MSEELKPCPFCGSTKISFSSHQIGIAAGCDSCGAVSEIRGSKEQCTEAWNRRAQPAEADGVEAFELGDGSGARVIYADDHLAELSAVTAERDQLRAAISDPESVFVNMKRGTIAKPSLRSMIDLYGDVVNGDEAQLLEIAKLRAEVERMQKALSPLVDIAHERRHSLMQQRFSDNDEGDAFARHRDAQVGRISRIIDAAMAAKEG